MEPGGKKMVSRVACGLASRPTLAAGLLVFMTGSVAQGGLTAIDIQPAGATASQATGIRLGHTQIWPRHLRRYNKPFFR